jgi:hypothetical protein
MRDAHATAPRPVVTEPLMTTLRPRSGCTPRANVRAKTNPGVETIEDLLDGTIRFQQTIRSQQFVFMVHLIACGPTQPFAFAEKGRLTIVVIELEDVGFRLSPPEPESAKGDFAECLARQIALMAVEKDLPRGVELSLSAKRIDEIPPECDNRLPDFCVEGNDVWFVDSRRVEPESSPPPVLEFISGFSPQLVGGA